MVNRKKKLPYRDESLKKTPMTLLNLQPSLWPNTFIEDGAQLFIYDPKVKEEKIKQNLYLLLESRGETEASIAKKLKQVKVPS